MLWGQEKVQMLFVWIYGSFYYITWKLSQIDYFMYYILFSLLENFKELHVEAVGKVIEYISFQINALDGEISNQEQGK